MCQGGMINGIPGIRAHTVPLSTLPRHYFLKPPPLSAATEKPAFQGYWIKFHRVWETLERALHKINSQSKALKKQNKSLNMKVEHFLSVCFQADVLSINKVT